MIETDNGTLCVIDSIMFGSIFLTKEQAENMHQVFLQASDRLEESGEVKKADNIRSVQQELWKYILEMKVR